MRRSQLTETLEAYVAGDLEETVRLDIERRIVDEPETRALYARIRAAHDALCTLRDRPAPPVEANAVLPAIQAAIASDVFRDRPKLYLEGQGTRYYRRVAIAATLLLAVTFGAFAVSRLQPEAPRPVVERPRVDRAPLTDADLDSLVREGSKRGGITAEEYFRILEKMKRDPRELTVTPVVNVVPGFGQER